MIPTTTTAVSRKTLPVLAAGLFALAAGTASLHAQAVPVPNNSFELPPVPQQFPALPFAVSWTQIGGTLNQDAGVFPNPALNQPSYIDNIDGNQAAYLLQYQPVGLYQDLADTYQAGKAYDLTVAAFGKGAIHLGSVFQLSLLYFSVSQNSELTLGTATATYNGPQPILDHFYDYSLNLPTVLPTDEWAGQPIRVQLFTTPAGIPEQAAGYWDVDNVRLTATPEPTSLSLLVCGVSGLLAIRPRTRRVS